MFRRGSICCALAGLLLLAAAPANAQYGFGSSGSALGDSDAGSAPGDPLRQRYNKAKNGANLDEWVRRLNDDEPARRLEAVKSLGDSKDPKANDYLMQAVGDPDPRIQSKSVEYLGKLRATDSTLFLIQRLFMTGTNAALRHRILMALGKIGDSRAAKPVLDFVQRDVAPDMRGTGIYTIGEIGDTSILQDLKGFSENEEDPRLRRLADEAIAKISQRETMQVKDTGGFPTALDVALHPEK
jgi:hypothetical protein